VKKNIEPPKQFDVGKEKETFKEARQDFINKNVASTSFMQHTQYVTTYEMLSAMDHTSEVNPRDQVSNIQTILQSCVQLFKDPSSITILQNVLDRCNTKNEGKLNQKTVNHLHAKRRTSKEFRLNSNIEDFNMGYVILDLGSEVNVLPKNTWQCMGEPTLEYSPIEMKLANQHKFLTIGRLKGVTLDLDGVCTKEYFKVIEIVDGTTPYPTLLGLD